MATLKRCQLHRTRSNPKCIRWLRCTERANSSFPRRIWLFERHRVTECLSFPWQWLSVVFYCVLYFIAIPFFWPIMDSRTCSSQSATQSGQHIKGMGRQLNSTKFSPFPRCQSGTFCSPALAGLEQPGPHAHQRPEAQLAQTAHSPCQIQSLFPCSLTIMMHDGVVRKGHVF